MSNLKTQILIQALARRLTRARVLKSEDAWEKLYRELQDAMTRAWDDNMRNAAAAALDHLRELDQSHFTEEDAQLIHETLENRVGVVAMIAALYGPLLNLTEAFYRTGIQEVVATRGVDVSFRHLDQNAINITQRANLYWVGNSWNTYTDKLLRQSLTDYFKQGYSRQQLIERLANDFAGLTERGHHYWNLLADHIATRTREIGRIDAYTSAQIKYIQIRAHLDARTSDVCRKMHGKIIPVERLVAQRDAYLKAASERDMETAKQVWHMWKESDDLSQLDVPGEKLPTNTVMPPYHFRCRTISVVYFR
ncbi:MAG: hypothetical protein B6247_07740 [Candidatus Parabeggiatoa sp. nov. 2]|nr:MAG: hypothetical protein B6247_07740 [Beggiatoa sp. 4572_84]